MVGVDRLGRVLGELTITATVAGYRRLVDWLGRLGGQVTVGLEGAGSYGAGLCEYLLAEGIAVVEVERPRRRDRRRGKSDRIDALAAKKVVAGEGLSTPRAGGIRQALQALLIAQRSCVAERTRLLNQLQALHTTAPIALRERIGPGNGTRLAARLSTMRPRAGAPDSERLILGVLRDLARRARHLHAQADHHERQLARPIRSLDPTLLDEERGLGPISAAKLLACDPRRLKNEAAFARCNGTAPTPASSGQTIRYRLNRGGDRHANNAPHTIALSRSIHDDQTRAYLQRRIAEGKTNREAMRALKRRLSRRLYKRLITIPLTS